MLLNTLFATSMNKIVSLILVKASNFCELDGSFPQGSSSGVTAWVITPSEQDRYDEMFKTADLDKDGFVNGIEIKDLFLQSGIPQQVLAHIWYVSVLSVHIFLSHLSDTCHQIIYCLICCFMIF